VKYDLANIYTSLIGGIYGPTILVNPFYGQMYLKPQDRWKIL